ncbi:MAG TPA: hypothetical protein PLW31_14545 [Bacteroidales bacterium]|nr:hypothetical protein [Bacteroidales bacterium]HOX79245.1 hypothetical protein [Bacteroidales bacterium]HPI86184.1 hypothetical protein [Bacteroidales bacterium]HPM93085.1 hypothetical protein [Bacteroidales bacterium]
MITQSKGKYLLLGLLLVASFRLSSLYGQISINSPYTRYGLGTLVENGNDPRITAMGGLYSGFRSPSVINTANPASYTAFDSVSFVFDAGVFGLMSNLQVTNQKNQGSYVSLSHLLFGFPVTRWWRTSFGVLPFSYVGYDIFNTEQQTGMPDIQYVYRGSGGLNQLYWGNGFKIGKKLSVGFNVKYLFGNITRSRGVTFPDSIEMKNTYIRSSMRPSDFYGEIGFQYREKLSKDLFMVIGGVFGPELEIGSSTSRLVTTYFGDITEAQLYYDTIDAVDNEKGSFTLPMRTGGGITLGKDGKWMAGADFTWQNWEKYRYNGNSDSLVNRWSVGVGGEYIPDSRNIGTYFQRVAYRIGFQYGRTPIYLKGKYIDEFGISFGMGLPIKKSKSTVNLAATIGKRGTIQNGLIQENFIKFTIAVNVFENWFFKSKYY